MVSDRRQILGASYRLPSVSTTGADSRGLKTGTWQQMERGNRRNSCAITSYEMRFRWLLSSSFGALRSHGLQRLAPRDEVIEHRVDRRLLLRPGFERRELFEISIERQRDLGPNVGNLDL